MGADARWVCHTCKTVCSRGGTPVVYYHDGVVTAMEVRTLLESVNALGLEEGHFFEKDVITSFLDDLISWLGRHEGHVSNIGSDYSTDGMDLEDYYDEAVDGTKNSMTRHEVQMGCLQVFEKRALEDIKNTIREHGDDLDGAARELYNRFSVGNM